MPLAIYHTDPNLLVFPDTALTDLLECIDGDPGLRIESVNALFWLLEYSRNRPSFGAQRVDDIVNSSFTEWVTIAAVESDAVVGNILIKGYGGLTFDPYQDEILCVYDSEMCDGEGYHAFNNAGGQIDLPRYVILFHELAHAFQLAMFGSANGTAIQAENSLRLEDGLPMRSGHEGGCGSPQKPDCFIATAAEAHFRRADFDRLKWIRDSVLRRQPLTKDWFDALFAEYDQYSARISAAMYKDPVLRESIYLIAVGPLLHFYQLVRDWLGWRAQHGASTGQAAAHALGPGLMRFFSELRGPQYTDFALSEVPSQLQRLLSCDPELSSTSVKVLRREPEGAMGYVRGVFESTGLRLPMTRWAIVEPLIAMWELATASPGEKDATSRTEQMLNFLENWMLRIPAMPGGLSADRIAQLDAWARTCVPSTDSQELDEREPWPIR